MTPQAMEHEVELLHELLCNVERIENFIVAHEIIDLNKYKIINKSQPLRNFFSQAASKPFVFLNCKN